MIKRLISLFLCVILFGAMFSGCMVIAFEKDDEDDRERKSSRKETIAESDPTETTEPPTTEATAPTEPVHRVDPAVWKAAYLEYLKQFSSLDFDYRLVYLDADEIPELFVSGACEADGSIICTYYDGEVVSQYLRRLGGASYIPQSGLVYNCNGNMGYYTTHVYRLSDGQFINLFYGLQADEYANETVTSTYTVYGENNSETIVSENEYYKAINAVFDMNASDDLYYYNDSRMYSYSGVRSAIENW